MRPEPTTDDRGLALVSVLWAVAVVGLVAFAVVSRTFSAQRAEHIAWENQLMERDAETALAMAVLALTDSRADRRWRTHGAGHVLAVGEASAEVSVSDELGRIDLNTGDEAVLQNLVQQAGLTQGEARDIAGRVVERRARGKPFLAVRDLLEVKGVTTALLQRVASALTVHSQARAIDPMVAPRLALMALPGMTEGEVERILASQNIDATPLPLSSLPFRPLSMEIRIIKGGRQLERHAVLRITPAADRPYLLLAWERSWVSASSL